MRRVCILLGLVALLTIVHGQGTLYKFRRLEGSCTSAYTVQYCRQADCPTVETCADLCDGYPSSLCVGFTYPIDPTQGGDCEIKANGCEEPQINQYDRYYYRYDANMAPEPTQPTPPPQQPFTIPPGYYANENSNCLEGELRECFQCTTVDYCASECNQDFQCRGFSFGSDRCILRSTVCQVQVYDDYTFFEKAAPARPETAAPQPAQTWPPQPAQTWPPQPEQTWPPQPEQTWPPQTRPPVTSAPRQTFPPQPQTGGDQRSGWSPPAGSGTEGWADSCSVTAEQRSEGKVFYIMFNENIVGDPSNIPLEVYVTPGSSVPKGQSFSATVSAPGRPDLQPPQTYIVTSGDVQLVNVSYDMRMLGTGVDKKCVKVVGDDYLVVYGVNKETFTNDGFLGIAVPGLGMEYYVVTQFPNTYHTEFGVAATEDNTMITITFPRPENKQGSLSVNFEGRQYTWGDKLETRLDDCGTLHIQGGTSGDLTGTFIKASKPVAVFSGNARTNVPGESSASWTTRDHLVEQMPPIDSWGTEFIMCPIPGRTVGDVFYLVASHDDTLITIKGERVRQDGSREPYEKSLTLEKAGDYHRYIQDSNVYARLEAKKGLLVTQIVLSQDNPGSAEEADPAMIIIPPIAQYDYRYSFSTSSYAGRDETKAYTQNLYVIAQTNDRDNVLIDGDVFGTQPLGRHGQGVPPVEWQAVVGSEWSCGYSTVTQGAHTLAHRGADQGESASKPFAGILYGAGDRESYAYPVGMKTGKLNVDCVQCKPTPCDPADNDCDGQINEELCDGIDNDGDGLIDEDCCGFPAAPPPTTEAPVETCEVREDQRSEGKDFVVMFMENFAADVQGLPLELYVTTGSSVPPGSVVSFTASTPGVPSLPPQSYTIETGKVQRVLIDSSLRMQGSGVDKKCIAVSGDQFMVVYGVNKETFTSDGFLGIAVAGLGTEHYVVTQYPATNNAEIGIAAVEDGTQVTVQLPSSGDGNLNVDFAGQRHTWGGSFTINMDRCSTAQIQSGQSGDLSGTLVKGTKPIAVFSGNSRTNVPGDVPGATWSTRDHLVEQIPPASSWGKSFISCPIPERTTGDIHMIVASQADTEVQIIEHKVNKDTGELINTSERTIRLDKPGSFSKFISASDAVLNVSSSKGILMTKTVMSQAQPGDPEEADPALIVIPPVSQYDNRYAFATSEYAGRSVGAEYIQNLMVMSKKSSRDSIQVDNAAFGRQHDGAEAYWVDIPQSEWSCGYTQVLKGSHQIKSNGDPSPGGETSTAPNFGGILYGAGDRESYGYPIGMKTQSLNVQCKPCPMTPCDVADNDCDGTVNEEYCDGQDDDGDGLIDEDCCGRRPVVKTGIMCAQMDVEAFCFGQSAEVSCSGGKELKIHQAHFGRIGYKGDDRCGPNPGSDMGNDVDCGFADMYSTVAPRCDGKASCRMMVDSELLNACSPSGPCALCAKYLEIGYQCIEPSKRECSALATIDMVAMAPGQITASSQTNTVMDALGLSCPAGGSDVPSSLKKYTCDGGKGNTCEALRVPDDNNLCAPKWAIFASDNTHAWCPEKCDKKNSFLQIDLGNKYEVNGVVLQGCRKFEKWVSQYRVKLSTDGNQWDSIQENGQDYVFTGNSNSYDVNYCTFGPRVARYVRIYVEDFNVHPCAHAEVIRCKSVK